MCTHVLRLNGSGNIKYIQSGRDVTPSILRAPVGGIPMEEGYKISKPGGKKKKKFFCKKAKRHATSGTVSGLGPSFPPSVRLGRRSGGTEPQVGLEGLETDVTLEIYTVRFKEQRL